jgi:1,2-diacylglycerol 3-beta-glucosyltransferase
MGIHALRLLLAKPAKLDAQLEEVVSPSSADDFPFISLLVAAKNEEAVLGRLVETLCQLDYPSHRYELWIIDDNSTDRTPQVLMELSRKYSQLRSLQRLPGASGGKSGALNQVLPLTRGEIIGVFDADAQVPQDLLRQILPLFARANVGAVQVRKATINAGSNFWTQGQAFEMILDTYFQQQRAAVGGLGELRGNGQFVRRQALQRCGGWNEQTITDDLDLSLRLHLDRWDIEVLFDPAVAEEGVTTALALWHQRNRWAEGGYQSYLDYWWNLAQNRLGTRKSIDMLMFLITKYLLPTAAVPDFVMSVARNRAPVLWPMTCLMLLLSLLGMVQGWRQVRQYRLTCLDKSQLDPETQNPQTISARMLSTVGANSPELPIPALWRVFTGMVYMLHWAPVIPSVTARMSIRSKRLKWVKTVHHGAA